MRVGVAHVSLYHAAIGRDVRAEGGRSAKGCYSVPPMTFRAGGPRRPAEGSLCCGTADVGELWHSLASKNSVSIGSGNDK